MGGLSRGGGAWFARAGAGVGMAAAILRDGRGMRPATCLLDGQYGLEGMYMGVPAVLGAQGVEAIVELPLKAEERIAMQKTAGAIAGDLETLREMGLL